MLYVPIKKSDEPYFVRQVKAGKKSLPRGAAEALMLGVALSLAVELTQAWLPTRDSSMADLIANTAGAGMGAGGGIAWLCCLRRLRRPPYRPRLGADPTQSGSTSK